jgi:hypothetical protein
MKKSYTLVLIAVYFLNSLKGQILFDESFPVLGTLTSNGWAAHSTSALPPTLAVATSLDVPGYARNGGNSAHINGDGEDINKPFTSAVTSGNLYISFMVRVNGTTASGTHFLHTGGVYTTNANTHFGRVQARQSGSNFNFGLLKGNAGGATVWETTLRNYGTDYLLVLKIEVVPGATNDIASLFIFSGPPPLSEPASANIVHALGNDATAYSNVAFRRVDNLQNIFVGGILAGTTWGAAPLPVNLKRLAGKVVDNEHVINWESESEYNVASYSLTQKSNSEEEGSTLTFDAKNRPSNYKAVFNPLENGKSIYRLYSTDIDGRKTFHGSVALDSKISDEKTMIFPNPCLPGSQVLTQNYPNGENYQIFDFSGRLVQSGIFSGGMFYAPNTSGAYILKSNDRQKSFIVSN